MTTAHSLFLTYGVLSLAYGMLLGVPLASARVKGAAPRYLLAAHLAALMQGAMHLGLAYATNHVQLSKTWATTAALLLVIASALESAGATLNWLTNTADQFAEKSLGLKLNIVSGPLALFGIGIVVVGVLR